MWLSDLSIKRPVFITMVMISMIIVGWLLYVRLPVDLFPDISMPVVAIQTVYPGAGPEEVESLVTKPIEEAVSSIARVQNVRSSSAENVSLVTIEFAMEYDPKRAADDVREQVSNLKNVLPVDAQEPLVLRFDPNSAPIISIAIADNTNRMSSDRLRALLDDVIVPRLERVGGVATVDAVGGMQREIHVDLAVDRLQVQALTAQQVIGAIKGENLDLPSGRLTEGGREQLLRTAGEFTKIEDIGAVPLTNPRGGVVYVRDVATVRDEFKEVRERTRLNGRDSVVANVIKQSGTNTVAVADAVKVELSRLKTERPELEFAFAIDQSAFTRESTQDVLVSLIIGAILAAFVVLLFFRDLRNTLVTVAGLPVIVITSFAAMNLVGSSLNMITLLALSISIGMLIDDAIVVRENIFRHMEDGQDPREAASKGTAEIALAVLATTLTIVAVFGPIAFTSGVSGRFLREFGITVALAVLISLFEAFTLAPMLSAYFFKRIPKRTAENQGWGGRLYGFVEDGYRKLLRWTLKRRWFVVILALAVFGATLSLVPRLGQSFMADFDRGELTVNLEMAPGATLDDMDHVARSVETLLRDQPERPDVFTTVGSADGAVEKANVRVRLSQRGALDDYVRRIRPLVANFPGVRTDVDLQSNSLAGMITASFGSARGRPFQISLDGNDLAALDQASLQVMDVVKQIPGAVDVDRSFRPGKPQLNVKVDRARAADVGVGTAQIGVTVRTLVYGETASKFRDGDHEVDIVVRAQQSDRANAANIAALPILTPRGGIVTLGALATLESATGPAQIDHLDRQREIVVGSSYLGRELGAIYNDARVGLAQLKFPPGVSYQFAGTTKYMDEAFSSLVFALQLAILLIYMVLASQFGSFVHPLTIMLALPLSFSGAITALILTGKTLDMVALIGIILLMGLVTKNSILLVDFINSNRNRGMARNEAVLAAGPIRLRPILMTTLAMIFGMLPIALGYGAGAEVRAPMAITVIGGLITSTLLTLLVVPTVYTLIDDVIRFVPRRPPESKVSAAKAEAVLLSDSKP